ncbi:hypothetical protein E8E12_001118 [Didymella heteroderae]|uniref:Uncharacterized protein n=1 Tax=Didymella heteroderae TaxID=1769908 RepID=A0A9P4WFU8_9PLEO|nr:hypothetical protein E8E12_001118 [Didymella heteroderae]
MKSNPKHGFPVLVYLKSEPLSLQCTLRIQHHEPRKQMTLMLRTCVSLHGADEQAFVAQYDADNLTVGDATVYIPEDCGAKVSRNPTSSQLTTLSLLLSHPCPLWCPRTEVLQPVPEPAHVAAFSELVQLAKAVTVHLVFDYNWLSLDARVPYQRLLKGKQDLKGFPVHSYYSRFYHLLDWRAFAPAEVLNTPATSNKRQRRVSSPLPSPPPYKRKVVEPEPPPSPTELATSPATAKSNDDVHDCKARAMAAAVQRHLSNALSDMQVHYAKHIPGVVGGSCIFCGRIDKHLPGCMFQDDESDARCVADLMGRCLPDLLADQLPAALEVTVKGKCLEQKVGEVVEVSQAVENETKSKPQNDEHGPRSRAIFRIMQLHMPAALADALPTALKRILPDVLPDVLSTMLPNILPAVLPGILPAILPALFALPTSFTSSYDSSSFDDSPSPPSQGPLNDYNLRLRDLTDLGAALLPHLLKHLQPQLSKMHARSMARGVHYWQKSAFLDLEETAEGYKGELSRLRDDGVEELHREARHALDGVREEAGGVAEDVEDEVCERVEDEIRRRGNAAVRDVRRAIQAAMQEAEQQGGGDARARGGRRVGKGGYRGVGYRGGPPA